MLKMQHRFLQHASPIRVPDVIIVTRPVRQAEPLARKIATLGCEVVLFPLLEIQPLHNPETLRVALEHLDDTALVAFVSPNAIDAAFEVVRDWPSHIKFAVMGEGSRMALAHHGVTSATATIFSPADPARTDSQTLLAALDLDQLNGKRVLIVRGESGRELLADALSAAGISVTQVAAYRRVAPTLDGARRAQLLQLAASANDWIITSSEALRNLVAMATEAGGTQAVARLQQQRLIVPHARIDETARALGFSDISLIGSGDDCLLAALQSRA
jgi:uroporphyrinogen-III synthase